MKNLSLLFFFGLSLCLSLTLYAQPGPTCTSLNIPIEQNDSATIVVGNFVPNAAAAAPLTVTLENPYGGVIEIVENAADTTEIQIAACPYLGRTLKLVVSNGAGACWSNVTFKQSNAPLVFGRSTTVLCTDDLVAGGHINGRPPIALVPCRGRDRAELVGDWVDPFDCVPGNDTAKIIYRQYEAFGKDGTRGVGYDTIVVFRLPPITPENLYCAERDTSYCSADTGEPFGPFLVVYNPATQICDTIYLIDSDGEAVELDPKCGLSVGVHKEPFKGECVDVDKYTVAIKQTCYGAPNTICPVVNPPSTLAPLGPGYWECVFWHIDIDTIPPDVTCALDGQTFDGDTLIVPTGSHDCAAHLSLPPATATDSCHDVKLVKAIVEGIGTFQLEKVGGEWVSSEQIKIPLHENAISIIYEAFDDCHNVGTDTCYIRVKDHTKPVAVCEKGVNVSLTGKKVWVPAASFDEGSWDNCGINMILARRSDWLEACVEICDSLVVHYEDDHHTVYAPYLSRDKTEEPIEAHYAKTIEWLDTDGDRCGKMIAGAWHYALQKHATVDCEGEMDEHTYHELFLQGHGSDYGDPDQIRQIGGGWNEDVFFSCDDACGPVTVEILVMDYWCNWSKCWTDVWVEDKTPLKIGKDVVELIDITCKTYRDQQHAIDGEIDPVSLAELVERADAGEEAAFDALDELLGGYVKAWKDPYGNFVDEDGQELDCDIPFVDSTCECQDSAGTKLVYDDHLGWQEVDTVGRYCDYDADASTLSHGVVLVNCRENVHCDQDIWFTFDHCGQGVIYRKFKIWQGCPTADMGAGHPTDTIVRIQQIWVGNECELDSGMFTFPEDVTIDLCDIEFDADGSGNVGGPAHPDSIGRPSYTFDDDCRIVGIGYYDKVFRIVGGDEACYKVIRTWCFTDWCEVEKPIADNWWADPTYAGNIFKYTQKIVLRDTVGPTILIDPLAGGDVVNTPGCAYDFATTVDVADECGVISYRWLLYKIVKGNELEFVEDGSGTLDMSLGSTFDVAVPDLETGDYLLKAIVTDDCQNEAIDQYQFTVNTLKKPGVVCLTSITAELNPMDLDNDGQIDTGMVTIWAAEYQVNSSTPACDDRSLEYYIEFIDGVNDDTLDPEDADSLAIGCEHLPDPFMVRLWVKSIPSNTSDYCDVLVVPQDNMNACGDVSTSNVGVRGQITTELQESVEQVQVKAKMSDGTVFNFTTGASGAYNFAASLGLNVDIAVEKNVDPMNGISTADLVRIQKHILGKQRLETEYRMIAADVNDDDKINPLDLLELRSLILGKIDAFSSSNSWRFVNDVTATESYKISGLNESMAVDFTGIKIGDVNMSNDPSRSAGRTAGNLVIEVADQSIKPGNTYQVSFTARDLQQVEGYQFTLNFDAGSLRMRDIDLAAGLTDDNFGLHRIDEGLISTSWHASDLQWQDEGEPLFTLTFEALAPAKLSEVMTINGKITEAEAYTPDNQLLGVALNFTGEAATTRDFALYQNRPNPFRVSTAIGFVLPEQLDATITIYDVTGKVIQSIKGQYDKGYNEVNVEQSTLNTTGVLYYQLDSDTYTATRKMIVIR